MSDTRNLITRDEIEKIPVERKEHFLNGNAQVTNRSLGDLAGITGFGFHILEVEPGRDTTEFHFHHTEDECVFILTGQGCARCGDETFTVSDGDFIGYRRGGVAHTITNPGDTMMRCIVVGQRQESDVVDFPDQKKRMFRAPDHAWKVVDYADLKDRPKKI